MTAAALEDTTWCDDGLDIIALLAEGSVPFDSNDVRLAGLREPPRHPNQWGALFQKAQAKGLIVYVGHHRSGRKSRSGGACAQWVGKGAPQSD